MNQFLQKLYPFAQWIKAGNVQTQASDSGIGFNLDVSQNGFNTVQSIVQFQASMTMQNVADQIFNISTVPTPETYLIRAFNFYPTTVALLAPINGIFRIIAGYQAEYSQVYPNQFTAAGEVLAEQRFTLPVTTATIYSSSIPLIQIQKFVPPSARFTLQVFFDRLLTLGEIVEGDLELYGRKAEAPGLEIIQP